MAEIVWQPLNDIHLIETVLSLRLMRYWPEVLTHYQHCLYEILCIITLTVYLNMLPLSYIFAIFLQIKGIFNVYMDAFGIGEYLGIDKNKIYEGDNCLLIKRDKMMCLPTYSIFALIIGLRSLFQYNNSFPNSSQPLHTPKSWILTSLNVDH